MKPVGQIVIRPAVASDMDAVLALDRAVDRLPHWSAANYRAAIASNALQSGHCLFVVEGDGRVNGLASGVVHSNAEECWAELETIGVAPGMQRRGLGSELCRTVIAWCQAHGATYIDLEVRNRSVGPIALYRKLGFERQGTRLRYYSDPTDDAILMRLILKPRPVPPASGS